MTTYNKIILWFFSPLTILVLNSSTFYASATGASVNGHSSKIYLKNDYNSNIDVVIEPSEGTIIKSTPQIKQQLACGKEEVIEVKKEQLGNVDTFSITGVASIPSFHNKCSGLFFGNDYKVVITESKTLGPVCHFEKIKSATSK